MKDEILRNQKGQFIKGTLSLNKGVSTSEGTYEVCE